MKFNADKDQIRVIEGNADVARVMRNIAESGIQEDAFYIFDVQDVIQKYNNWKEKLPRVIPYYAVKCNDHAFMLKILASLKVGFDCASKEEMRKVLAMNVHPSRIIFANPAKPASHIRFASDQGVELITFDNENELYKMKNSFPSAKLLLRIRSDACVTQCPLGIKYGCNIVTEAPTLLNLARRLELDVIGICFHVGSGCGEPLAYRRSIAAAKNLFQMGNDLGFNMQLLDIGGGFPGNKGTSIDKVADIINSALEEYFPASQNVTVMAEPGRYFAASAFTLAAFVHSKREVRDSETGAHNNMYYINDGVYGSFNSILYDHAEVHPLPLSVKNMCDTTTCSIWGPTCDGLDVIVENLEFPTLNVGDWIMFEDMGAYTFSAACTFNGFSIPKVYTILDKATMFFLKKRSPAIEEEVDFERVPESVDIERYPLADEWKENQLGNTRIFDASAKCASVST